MKNLIYWISILQCGEKSPNLASKRKRVERFFAETNNSKNHTFWMVSKSSIHLILVLYPINKLVYFVFTQKERDTHNKGWGNFAPPPPAPLARFIYFIRLFRQFFSPPPPLKGIFVCLPYILLFWFKINLTFFYLTDFPYLVVWSNFLVYDFSLFLIKDIDFRQLKNQSILFKANYSLDNRAHPPSPPPSPLPIQSNTKIYISVNFWKVNTIVQNWSRY